MEGTDTDNIDFDPNDAGTYQEVYYDIVGKLAPLLVLKSLYSSLSFSDVV